MRLIHHPVLCNYYVTYRCNAKCSFCDIWELPSPYVTIEQVTENLRALKAMKVKVIDFTGGEPLLHRQLGDFLAIAREMGFITTVTTNCLLYPKYAQSLAGKIDMLHFSLDSADPEKHNQSRRVACYDHLIQSITIAKQQGDSPDILFTVNNENIGEIGEVYRIFHEGHGLMVILNPVFAYNEVGGELTSENLKALRQWSGRPGIYLNEAFLDLREQGGNQVSDPVCLAGSSTIVISPENKLVAPCYHLKTKEFPIEGNLRELHASPEVQALLAEEGRLPGCQGCTVNCYMEPSMAVEMNRWFLGSIGSTLRYALEKWVYA